MSLLFTTIIIIAILYALQRMIAAPLAWLLRVIGFNYSTYQVRGFVGVIGCIIFGIVGVTLLFVLCSRTEMCTVLWDATWQIPKGLWEALSLFVKWIIHGDA